MEKFNDLYQKVSAILEIARLAPSVHNTQPWIVQLKKNELTVSVDKNFALSDGDPTGRQTTISLGIFAEAIRIGAILNGLDCKFSNVKNTSFTAILIGLQRQARTNVSGQVKLLKQRCSNRSIYSPAIIEDELKTKLAHCSVSGDISVKVVTDKTIIDKVAVLTSKGIRLALGSPAFRKELSSYLLLPWSKRKRGISVKSLNLPWPLGILQPSLIRLGLGLNAEANLEKRRWESASAIVAISGKGDMPEHWFEAGQSYLQASLAIEQAGLSQATSAAIVEASNFHEDIEDLLQQNERILCLIRIGRGQKKGQHSPRLGVSELLTLHQ